MNKDEYNKNFTNLYKDITFDKRVIHHDIPSINEANFSPSPIISPINGIRDEKSQNINVKLNTQKIMRDSAKPASFTSINDYLEQKAKFNDHRNKYNINLAYKSLNKHVKTNNDTSEFFIEDFTFFGKK